MTENSYSVISDMASLTLTSLGISVKRIVMVWLNPLTDIPFFFAL